MQSVQNRQALFPDILCMKGIEACVWRRWADNLSILRITLPGHLLMRNDAYAFNMRFDIPILYFASRVLFAFHSRDMCSLANPPESWASV